MIVRLEKKDAPFLASFKEEFSDAYNLSQIESAFESERFFAFGSEENGETIGYITFSFSLDCADIESVFVKKEFRGKGVASSLMEAAISKIKELGVNRIMLEVRESNFAAAALYKKFGFEKISERKKYYGDGENACVMLKEI